MRGAKIAVGPILEEESSEDSSWAVAKIAVVQ